MEWDFTDLDEKPKLDNRVIHEVIKIILHDKKYNSIAKSCLICEVTQHISDENLFISTKELFKRLPFYEKAINKEYIVFLDESFKTCFTISLNGDEEALKCNEVELKLRVSVFSIALLNELFIYYHRSLLIDLDVPEIIFKFKNRKLTHNLTEISNFINKQYFLTIKSKILDIPNKSEQEKEIKNMILSLSTADFENDSNVFENEIKYFKDLVIYLPEPDKEDTKLTRATTDNLHPTMFINNSFKLFEHILENYITENRGRINDISFYYWKMFNDDLIIQRPTPFISWFSKKYSEDVGQIKTLNYTSNTNRLKHYSTALDWFKNQK